MKKLFKLVISLVLIGSALSQDPLQNEITVSTYTQKDQAPISMTSDTLRNKIRALTLVSRTKKPGTCYLHFETRRKTMQLSFKYFEKNVKRNIYTPLSSHSSFKVSFPFYPEKSYLGKDLVYTDDNQDPKLKLKVTEQSYQTDDQDNAVKQKELRRRIALWVKLGSSSLNIFKGELVSWWPRIDQLVLYTAHGTKLNGYKAQQQFYSDESTMNLFFILALILVLMIFHLFAIFFFLPISGTFFYLREVDVEFPFFGCTSVQLVNSAILMIWGLKFFVWDWHNLLLLAFILLPILVFNMWFLWKSVKLMRYEELSMKVLSISITLAVIWFVWLSLDYSSIWYHLIVLCLAVCVDLMALEKGTVYASQMSAWKLWKMFMGLCAFYEMHLGVMLVIYDFLDFMDFPGGFLRANSILIVFSFVRFFGMVRRSHARFRWMRAKREYSEPSRIPESIFETKEIILFSHGVRITEGEDNQFFDLKFSPEFQTRDNSFGFYPQPKNLIIGLNDYLSFESSLESSQLLYYVKNKRKWRYYLGQKRVFWKYLTQNIWLDEKRINNLIAIYRRKNDKDQIELFELENRKIRLRLELENLNDRLGSQDLLGLFIKGGGKMRFIALTLTENKTLLLWTQLNDRSFKLVASEIFDSKHNFRVKEKRYRELGQICDATPFENLVALKAVWIDNKDYKRDIINMVKFQTILILEVNERERTTKEINNLSKITEGMFSCWKIDSFFFIDRQTLAVIIEARVLVVDWEREQVQRCICLLGLPRIKHHDDWFRASFSYWYDRETKMVFFRAGVNNGNYFEDGWTYFSSIGDSKIRFTHSGYFSIGNREESVLLSLQEIIGYQEIAETSRSIIDEKTIELDHTPINGL